MPRAALAEINLELLRAAVADEETVARCCVNIVSAPETSAKVSARDS